MIPIYLIFMLIHYPTLLASPLYEECVEVRNINATVDRFHRLQEMFDGCIDKEVCHATSLPIKLTAADTQYVLIKKTCRSSTTPQPLTRPAPAGNALTLKIAIPSGVAVALLLLVGLFVCWRRNVSSAVQPGPVAQGNHV